MNTKQRVVIAFRALEGPSNPTKLQLLVPKVRSAGSSGDLSLPCPFFRALLTSELSEIFVNAPPAPQVRFIANQKVVGAWREATGRGPASSAAESSTGKTSFPYVLLFVLGSSVL